MKYLLLSCSLFLLIGCQSTKGTEKSTKDIFSEGYYQDLEKNISRLHQLSLGTFVAHEDAVNTSQEVWNVSGGKDSVILYSIPLGDINKDGYWILNYEFMTSLPNTPIYTSIKQIKQIDRDSFAVWYYDCPNDLTLKKLLNADYIAETLDLDKLTAQNKKVTFVRQDAAHFIGKSVVYEDKEAGCLRQNQYTLSPKSYDVSVLFFDKTTKEPLKDKERRPNLMIRRKISTKTLSKIANQNAS